MDGWYIRLRNSGARIKSGCEMTRWTDEGKGTKKKTSGNEKLGKLKREPNGRERP